MSSPLPRVPDAEGVRFLQWCLPRLRLQWRGFRRVRRQVYRSIERRLAELGLADLTAYRAYLESHEAEWGALDRLCRIPISRFYRDKAAFQQLETVVLPELARMIVARGENELRCWSIGCASGEEPYTIVLIWSLAVAPEFPRVRLRVLGTDTDRDALERAARGAYPSHSLRDLPPAMLARAFSESATGFVLDAEYRAGVEFLEQDVRVAMPDGPFHLVLCRNLVFTYFDADLQRQTLGRIVARLVPGGALMLGTTESLPGDDGLAPWSRRLRVYRRLA
jgi:chemotaxis protein methyltransferase CheR